MSREITQKTAWVLSVILSFCLFGGLAVLIVYLVPNDTLVHSEVVKTMSDRAKDSDRLFDSGESKSSDVVSDENIIRADDPEYLQDMKAEPDAGEIFESQYEDAKGSEK